MYDFWFGTHDEICADEEKYLLFVKRMLPRWSNSIPDSEYLAIHHALSTLDLGGRCPVVVETGVGAHDCVAELRDEAQRRALFVGPERSERRAAQIGV